MINTAIIIVNYFSSKDVINLVQQIYQSNTNNNYQIIIVDNSVDLVERTILKNNYEFNSGVVLIFNDNNCGYSKANNVGVKYCVSKNIKYFMILNPDIEFVTENPIQEFINIMEDNKSIIIIGPEVYNPFYDVHQSPINEFKPFAELFFTSKRDVSGKLNTEVYSVVGCCWFGKTDLFEQIGFFDEDFFLYSEELVIADKAKEKKYIIIYAPNIKIRHLHKLEYVGFKKEIKRKYFQIESQLLYLKKYKQFGFINLFILNIALWGRSLSIVFYKCILKSLKKI